MNTAYSVPLALRGGFISVPVDLLMIGETLQSIEGIVPASSHPAHPGPITHVVRSALKQSSLPRG